MRKTGVKMKKMEVWMKNDGGEEEDDAGGGRGTNGERNMFTEHPRHWLAIERRKAFSALAKVSSAMSAALSSLS